MSKQSSQWRTAVRKLGRSTILLIMAGVFFLSGVVVNLASDLIKPMLLSWLGTTAYPTWMWTASGSCLLLGVVIYFYDRRDDVPAQEDDASQPIDPEIDRRNCQVFINDMRRRFVEHIESAPKIIRLRLAERAGAVEPPGALVRPLR